MFTRGSIEVESPGGRPAFHDVTEGVRQIVATSGICNGIVSVSSHHTTCSVMTQEDPFDVAASGLETMHQDLVDAFERLLPRQVPGGMYLHPGEKALEFAAAHDEDFDAAHNTDAHLRSAMIGRSETIPLTDGVLDLGSFGRIWFVDFDQTRPRRRSVSVAIVGEPE